MESAAAVEPFATATATTSPQKLKEEEDADKLDDLNLPLKNDRLFMYRKVEAQVALRLWRIRHLPDTRRTSFFSTKRNESDLSWKYQLGCRDRQMKYLKYELLPMVSSCLLLEVQDLLDPELACPEYIEEPVKCITMLLSNILFLSNGNYDARLRSVVKTVCVELIQQVYSHQLDLTHVNSRNWYFLKKQDAKEVIVDGDEVQVQQTLYIPPLSKRKQATMRFEYIETLIATDILRSLVETSQNDTQPTQTDKDRTKRIVIRTLQIGSVGLVVGGLFAFTGGLAAPGLVAAISAFGIGSGSAAFATLTTTTALAAMFGLTGGGMAAYKMKRRTEMLTEWKIRNENMSENKDEIQIRVHATVAVTGWLLDKCDFQRPWGIVSTDPPIQDKADLLQRFFAVHGPEKVQFCQALLKPDVKKERGKKKSEKEKEKVRHERELWESLDRRYGRDPDHLVPFDTMGEDPVVSLETERAIATHIKEYILPHCARLGEVYVSNSMMVKMEAMNAQYFTEAGQEHMDEWLQEKLAKQHDCESSLVVNDEMIDGMSVNGNNGIASPPNMIQAEISEDISMMEAEMLVNFPSGLKTELGDSVAGAINLPAPLVVDSDEDNLKQTVPESEKIDVLVIVDGNTTSFTTSILDTDKIDDSNRDLDEKVAFQIEFCPDKVVDKKELLTDVNKEETTHSATVVTFLNKTSWNETNKNEHDQIEISCNHQPPENAKEWEDKNDSKHSNQLPKGDIADNDYLDENNSPHTDNDEAAEVVDPNEELTKKDHDVVVWDWQANYGGELYTLTWESDLLARLCRVVNLMFLEIGNQVSKQLAQKTILGGVVAAVHIPSAIATCLGVIDDPYQLISFRSDYAGIELANCLLHSEEHRPVSLVGYSFGARVIFSCLLELGRHQSIWEEQQKSERKNSNVNSTGTTVNENTKLSRGLTAAVAGKDAMADNDDKVKVQEPKKLGWRIKKVVADRAARREKEEATNYPREPASIVEDVCIIGMPRLVDESEWSTCREMVGGRVVNCYSRSDFFLTYLFQIRTWKGVSRMTAGTHPIEGITGVENCDVTRFVSTHGRYPLVLPQILHEAGFGEPDAND